MTTPHPPFPGSGLPETTLFVACQATLRLTELMLVKEKLNPGYEAQIALPCHAVHSMLKALDHANETIVRMHYAAAGAETVAATIGHVEDIQNYHERAEEWRLLACTLFAALEAMLNGEPKQVDLQWARKVLQPELYPQAEPLLTQFHTKKKG